MIMSTTTFSGFAESVATAIPAFAAQPISAIEARMQRAAGHVRPFLARLTDETLGLLGFSPAEIRAIRNASGQASELERL